MYESWFQAQHRIQSLLAQGRCTSWQIQHIFPTQILRGYIVVLFSHGWGDRTIQNFGRTCMHPLWILPEFVLGVRYIVHFGTGVPKAKIKPNFALFDPL